MIKPLAAVFAVSIVALFAMAPAHAADAPPAATQPAVQQQIVAEVGPARVTTDQLNRTLMDGYGLNVLLNLVQLEIAKTNTAKANIVVTPADIAAERDMTIENMFKESNEKQLDRLNNLLAENKTAEAAKLKDEIKHDNDQALGQFLSNQHISEAEFNVVIETNANLRKLAAPQLQGKISDENLKDAFNAMYGETVRCRHIQCKDLPRIQEAKQRLANGDPFPKVAMEMSENQSTAPQGGKLPLFSQKWQGVPQAFRDTAFALKPGQVSEVVHAEGSYHLILLEERIPPKAVKFEDVKESLRTDLQKRALEAAVKELRQQVSETAVKGLKINDSVLDKQWQSRLSKREGEIKSQSEINKQYERERDRATTQPAAAP